MIQIITNIQNNRLTYTLDFIFNEVLGVAYSILDTLDVKVENSGPCINYGIDKLDSNQIFIPSQGLLNQSGITNCTEAMEALAKNILTSIEKREIFTDDIFSLIFFMISRYEEYLPHEADQFGRFQAKNSLSYQLQILDRAIVDECILNLKNNISEKYPNYVFLNKKKFAIHSTIDIDQVWAYAHKGFRNVAGGIKDLIKGDLFSFKRRLSSFNNYKNDPFNTYELIESLHKKHQIKPNYFVLFASKTSTYDKNHDISETNFQIKIKAFAEKNAVGIHPSFRSNEEPNVLSSEIKNLNNLLKTKITTSRQHFIKLELPTTYRNLILNGIKEDYSMGYPEENGYRAGTGHNFYWYDLINECVTDLYIHPFQLMDVTLKNYKKLSASQAKTEINRLIKYAKEIDTPLCVIWHNSSLDEGSIWRGWTDVYESILCGGQEMGE